MGDVSVDNGVSERVNVIPGCDLAEAHRLQSTELVIIRSPTEYVSTGMDTICSLGRKGSGKPHYCGAGK